LFGGGGEAGESFPGLFTSGGFVTAADFASDHGGTKSPFSAVVGRFGCGVVEAAQQMGALFFQAFLDVEIPGVGKLHGSADDLANAPAEGSSQAADASQGIRPQVAFSFQVQHEAATQFQSGLEQAVR
jgi:hypothetical protein